MFAGFDDGTLSSSVFVGFVLFFTVGISLLAQCGKEGGARRPISGKATISPSKLSNQQTGEKNNEKSFHDELNSKKEKSGTTVNVAKSEALPPIASGALLSMPDDDAKKNDPTQLEVVQQSSAEKTPLLTDNGDSLKEKEQVDAITQAAINTLVEVTARANTQPLSPDEASPAANTPRLTTPAPLAEMDKAKENESKDNDSSSNSSSSRKERKKSKRKHKKEKKQSRKKKSKHRSTEKDKPKVMYPYVVTPPILPNTNCLQIHIPRLKKPAIFNHKINETMITEGGARPGEKMIEVEKSVYMAVPIDYAIKKEKGINPKTDLPYQPSGVVTPINFETGKPYSPGKIFATDVAAVIDPRTGLPHCPNTVYATGVPESNGSQTCIGLLPCKTGVDAGSVIQAATALPKGVMAKTEILNDELKINQTQVKLGKVATTQRNPVEMGIENTTPVGVYPIERACIEKGLNKKPMQIDAVVESPTSITAKQSNVETTKQRDDSEKTQKIGISLLSTKTGIERSDRTQNLANADVEQTQVDTLSNIKTQMSTSTLATPRNSVSAIQIQTATPARIETTQAPMLQTSNAMVQTGVNRIVQTIQPDRINVTQFAQNGNAEPTHQKNNNVKAPVHCNSLELRLGEDKQAEILPDIAENSEALNQNKNNRHDRKHQKRDNMDVSKTQNSELRPKKHLKSSKAEKIAELHLVKKATDYPTMNDVISDWSSNDITAAQLKEDDEKGIFRQNIKKDEQHRQNEELVRKALVKQDEEKKEREETHQLVQKTTMQTKVAQIPVNKTPKQEQTSLKEQRPRELKSVPAISSVPKTAKMIRNREEKERVSKMRENKPTPRKFKRSSWEEKIATGKVVRKAQDYPTMKDVISDWDTTDKSDASDQLPDSSKK